MNDVRTPYEIDVDRIAFSNSFRRLSRKTQVHPFCKNDHVHTRLTHSYEVAQVGRSLGKALGQRIADKLPEGVSSFDIGLIVHAACLAHDIGNPPFGHAGEEAISHWFASSNGRNVLTGLSGPNERDLARFEGNAQGFRTLTQTENYLFCGGLHLTYATLGAFCKYPWSSRKAMDGEKFGAFISEETILEKVADATGLVRREAHKWCRHPLAYLTEAADDICYATIDLEDAVELNVLKPREAYDLLFSVLKDDVLKTAKAMMVSDSAHRVNFARIRGFVFNALINGAIDAFMNNYEHIMNGEFSGELIGALDEGDLRRKLIVDAKEMGRTRIYVERIKTEVELGCFATFECLLDAFCTAAVECFSQIESPKGETRLSWKSQLVLRQLSDHSPIKSNPPPGGKWSKYSCLRRVLDFIAGMTDNYATSLAEQISGQMHHAVY